MTARDQRPFADIARFNTVYGLYGKSFSWPDSKESEIECCGLNYDAAARTEVRCPCQGNRCLNDLGEQWNVMSTNKENKQIPIVGSEEVFCRL